MKPRLLISVRNAVEARVVFRQSVEVVDVKEPNFGSLGRVQEATLSEIVEAASQEDCLSVALGELEGLPEQVFSWPILQRFSYAKIGLSGSAGDEMWQQKWTAALNCLPSSVQSVAVAYLDYDHCYAPSVEKVVAAAIEGDCHAVLLDTNDKTKGDLFAHVDEDELSRIVQEIQDASMLAVVAGSISIGSVDRVAKLKPDLIGVRGAVCRNKRTDEICENKLVSFVKQFEDAKRTFQRIES